MIVSRTVTANAFINKHTIKAMPVIDSNNERYIEEVSGNELRTINRYAATYDFIANQIDNARRTGNIGKYIKDADNYFSMWVSEKSWKAYFAKCGNHTIRAHLERQVFTDIETGWIFGKGVDSMGRRFISQIPPFRFMERRIFEDGTTARQIFFSKVVFESLVTEDCAKKGGDGYIEIPSNFYPILTGTDKGALTSYNPIYKLNVFGLYKNTHKVEFITVRRSELIKSIAPEYIDTKGHLKNISAADLHNSLIASTKEALEVIPDTLLVKNFFLGEERGDSMLYFRKPSSGKL